MYPSWRHYFLKCSSYWWTWAAPALCRKIIYVFISSPCVVWMNYKIIRCNWHVWEKTSVAFTHPWKNAVIAWWYRRARFLQTLRRRAHTLFARLYHILRPKTMPEYAPQEYVRSFQSCSHPHFHKNHLSTAAGEHKYAKNGCMKSRLAVLA